MAMNEESENSSLGNRTDSVSLRNKKDIWKNKQLSDLVDDYFENSYLATDLGCAVQACCKRASHLDKFEQEHHTVGEEGSDKKYSTNMEKFRNFIMVGNPFMEDLFKVLNSVYSHQLSLSERLQGRGQKMDNKLRILKPLGIVKPLLRNSRGQREIMRSMEMGIYVVIKSLDTIKTLAERFQEQSESFLASLVDLATESAAEATESAAAAIRSAAGATESAAAAIGSAAGPRVTMEMIKKDVKGLVELNRDLEEHVCLCISTLSRAKRRTLDMINNYPTKVNIRRL